MIDGLFLFLTGFGYIGIFLVSLIGSSTVIFPLPAATFVFLAAATLNPVLVGILAGLGASLGELVGYTIGRGGRELGKKFKKDIERAEKAFDRYGGFLAIVIFGATPLPDDIVGILAGLLKYEVKKFFLAVFIGKVVFHTILAFGGYYGINAILDLLF